MQALPGHERRLQPSYSLRSLPIPGQPPSVLHISYAFETVRNTNTCVLQEKAGKVFNTSAKAARERHTKPAIMASTLEPLLSASVPSDRIA